MPSWNIHTAHVERLLREHDARDLGIRDADAFLMGNILPDVYVGYMVPDASWRIDYKMTHLTMRDHIPLPRYQEFWDFYVERPEDYGANCTTDVVLGAWCHLVCDHVYNERTRAYLKTVHLAPGECARIKKQADFALFGQTLDISMKPRVTPAVIDQCLHFPQYAVAEKDVRAAADVASSIVDKNQENHIEGVPEYQLLTSDFFADAKEEANRMMVEGLQRFASEGK